MAELIGAVSGVMGVVLPVISQIEHLVDRSQNFRAAPSEFRDLKSHCESVTDSLHQLEGKLQQNASIAPEHIQQLTNDARVVNENFEKAQAECEKLEKYFPATRHDSFSCHGWLSRSRQALLRFLFAGRIAWKCEEISGIIKDANLNGTALKHFLHATVQINHVNNQVKQVGVCVANVDKKVDTIDRGVKHVGAGVTSMNEMLTTIKENTERSAADATDAFKFDYHVPGLSQGIILDFSTCDAEGVHVTMEGKLKRALLENGSQSEFSRVAVAVGGWWYGQSWEDQRLARSRMGH